MLARVGTLPTPRLKAFDVPPGFTPSIGTNNGWPFGLKRLTNCDGTVDVTVVGETTVVGRAIGAQLMVERFVNPVPVTVTKSCVESTVETTTLVTVGEYCVLFGVRRIISTFPARVASPRTWLTLLIFMPVKFE